MKKLNTILRFPLLFSIFFTASNCCAQNYVNYQQRFNRIDEYVLRAEIPSAITCLDSIYNTYDFIYANHCIKALQICCSVNDSIRADKWLARCMMQGVPLWAIRRNELMLRSVLFVNTQKTFQKSDSFYAIYNSRRNKDIAALIDSLYARDQKFTRRVNDGFFLLRYTLYGLRWLHNNKKQFAVIHQITRQFGFPGEKLIGLPSWLEDSASSAKMIQIYGPELFDFRAYYMLIHYYSNPHRDINAVLFENVSNGFMPAFQYGAINDFLATWGKDKYGQFVYYNVWHHDPDTANMTAIHTRRAEIGLNGFAQQERNKKLRTERRKNKSIHSEIILE